jgi:hypothetical protein
MSSATENALPVLYTDRLIAAKKVVWKRFGGRGGGSSLASLSSSPPPIAPVGESQS